MNTQTVKTLLIGGIGLLLLIGQAFAHGGGLDSNGGHHNRKTGEYHYHRGNHSKSQVTPAAKPKVEKKSPESTAEKDQRIGDYFRQANENVGALSCEQVIHERGVLDGVKAHVRQRDGNHCVICGSTTKLEVDHKRALMNGGSNDSANLATLCDDCHTAKTRMDNSLRHKREKICRN